GGYKPREDWYLSHDYAVVAELARRGAPEELIRAVSEVHGLVPFTTLEGLIVHLSDSVDARLGEILQNMVLNRVRDYEARNCQLYKALNNMIENHGLKYVLRLMFNNPDELRELFEKECNTRSSQ
ncbi:MAG: phosphohydrolase, partial [Desulfurococcaceae archaeon]